MKVAVFGKTISVDSKPHIELLHQELLEAGVEIVVYHRLYEFLQNHCNLEGNFPTFSDHHNLLKAKPDFLFTIGGDGTILDAVTFVRDSGIPILGVNTGRLGFLSNVSKDKIKQAVKALLSDDYSLDERYLLNMECDPLDLDLNFALNEITVSRKETTAMVTIHTWIDGHFLNSYWADGLIIATPTGSTGYSLSCNGPIIMPGSENFVITPIAPHNLNVRPCVIPNNVKIKLKVESREEQHLVSLDSRIYTLNTNTELFISLENFKIRLVKTDVQDFADTLRSKLLWGIDQRN